MRFFFAITAMLFFLSACSSDSRPNQTKYSFIDQNNKNLTVKSDFETLDLSSQNKEEKDKVTFIAFLDPHSQACKDYVPHLNHLMKTFPKADVIGILTKNTPQSEVEEFIKSNSVEFPLLNPTDGKNALNDFREKIISAQNAQSDADGADEATKTTSAEDSSFRAPFFVLYDKHGKKYQTYEGIVPEEMFAHDVDLLLKMR